MARSQRALISRFAAPFLALGLASAPAIAWAQSYGMPPANVGNGDSYGGGGSYNGGGGGPGDSGSSDAAGMVVRVQQLEQQMRQLNGDIQQLQFANRQLQDQLKKLQQDVDFRFQELSRKGGAKAFPKHSERTDVAPPPVQSAAANPAPGVASASPSKSRDDAFDPARDPNAPGVPRALGSRAPMASNASGGDGAAAASNPDAPMTLLSSPHESADAGIGASPATSAASTTNGPLPSPSATTPSKVGFTSADGTVIADSRADAPKEQFDIALGYMKQKDYADAERSFSAFVAKNPKNKHISDAIYYLGETYYLRGRQREAAEQYLKISTNYAKSPRAPEAMLRLGEALHALGAKEQACATFNEVPRKYPRAAAAIKASAQREAKRAQC